MTLEDAYQQLGLRNALDFEAERLILLKTVLPSQRISGIGTTTRMLVEAALDVTAGGYVHVCVPTRKEVREAKAKLWELAKDLGAEANYFSRIDVSLPESTQRNSFAIKYQDHCRDPIEDIDVRLTGPIGWARTVRRSILHLDYDVFDRDGRLLSIVTENGLAEIKRRQYTHINGPYPKT